jgi:hypothetical protein
MGSLAKKELDSSELEELKSKLSALKKEHDKLNSSLSDRVDALRQTTLYKSLLYKAECSLENVQDLQAELDKLEEEHGSKPSPDDLKQKLSGLVSEHEKLGSSKDILARLNKLKEIHAKSSGGVQGLKDRLAKLQAAASEPEAEVKPDQGTAQPSRGRRRKIAASDATKTPPIPVAPKIPEDVEGEAALARIRSLENSPEKKESELDKEIPDTLSQRVADLAKTSEERDKVNTARLGQIIDRIKSNKSLLDGDSDAVQHLRHNGLLEDSPVRIEDAKTFEDAIMHYLQKYDLGHESVGTGISGGEGSGWAREKFLNLAYKKHPSDSEKAEFKKLAPKYFMSRLLSHYSVGRQDDGRSLRSHNKMLAEMEKFGLTPEEQKSVLDSNSRSRFGALHNMVHGLSGVGQEAKDGTSFSHKDFYTDDPGDEDIHVAQTKLFKKMKDTIDNAAGMGKISENKAMEEAKSLIDEINDLQGKKTGAGSTNILGLKSSEGANSEHIDRVNSGVMSQAVGFLKKLHDDWPTHLRPEKGAKFITEWKEYPADHPGSDLIKEIYAAGTPEARRSTTESSFGHKLMSSLRDAASSPFKAKRTQLQDSRNLLRGHLPAGDVDKYATNSNFKRLIDKYVEYKDSKDVDKLPIDFFGEAQEAYQAETVKDSATTKIEAGKHAEAGNHEDLLDLLNLYHSGKQFDGGRQELHDKLKPLERILPSAGGRRGPYDPKVAGSMRNDGLHIHSSHSSGIAHALWERVGTLEDGEKSKKSDETIKIITESLKELGLQRPRKAIDKDLLPVRHMYNAFEHGGSYREHDEKGTPRTRTVEGVKPLLSQISHHSGIPVKILSGLFPSTSQIRGDQYKFLEGALGGILGELGGAPKKASSKARKEVLKNFKEEWQSEVDKTKETSGREGEQSAIDAYMARQRGEDISDEEITAGSLPLEVRDRLIEKYGDRLRASSDVGKGNSYAKSPETLAHNLTKVAQAYRDQFHPYVDSALIDPALAKVRKQLGITGRKVLKEAPAARAFASKRKEELEAELRNSDTLTPDEEKQRRTELESFDRGDTSIPEKDVEASMSDAFKEEEDRLSVGRKKDTKDIKTIADVVDESRPKSKESDSTGGGIIQDYFNAIGKQPKGHDKVLSQKLQSLIGHPDTKKFKESHGTPVEAHGFKAGYLDSANESAHKLHEHLGVKMSNDARLIKSSPLVLSVDLFKADFKDSDRQKRSHDNSFNRHRIGVSPTGTPSDDEDDDMLDKSIRLFVRI